VSINEAEEGDLLMTCVETLKEVLEQVHCQTPSRYFLALAGRLKKALTVLQKKATPPSQH